MVDNKRNYRAIDAPGEKCCKKVYRYGCNNGAEAKVSCLKKFAEQLTMQLKTIAGVWWQFQVLSD